MFVENDLLNACQNMMMRNEKKRKGPLQQVSTCPNELRSCYNDVDKSQKEKKVNNK